jgi:hypothetical protein
MHNVLSGALGGGLLSGALAVLPAACASELAAANSDECARQFATSLAGWLGGASTASATRGSSGSSGSAQMRGSSGGSSGHAQVGVCGALVARPPEWGLPAGRELLRYAAEAALPTCLRVIADTLVSSHGEHPSWLLSRTGGNGNGSAALTPLHLAVKSGCSGTGGPTATGSSDQI